MTSEVNVLFIDFEDSFSNNILNLLYLNKIFYKKIKYYELKDKSSHYLEDYAAEFDLIIYGPGPGNVQDYQDVFKPLKRLLLRKDIFHWGICLGHQLIWTLLGGFVKPSLNKIHGSSVEITLPKWDKFFNFKNQGKKIKVQRYNSWTIVRQNMFNMEYIFQEDTGEVLGFSQNNYLGYQFHPESIGTSCPNVFFDWINDSHFRQNPHNLALS